MGRSSVDQSAPPAAWANRARYWLASREPPRKAVHLRKYRRSTLASIISRNSSTTFSFRLDMLFFSSPGLDNRQPTGAQQKGQQPQGNHPDAHQPFSQVGDIRSSQPLMEV